MRESTTVVLQMESEYIEMNLELGVCLKKSDPQSLSKTHGLILMVW